MAAGDRPRGDDRRDGRRGYRAAHAGACPSEPLRPRRVLVTGAGGFVGTRLRAALAERDPTIDIVSTGIGGETVWLDLTDAQAVDAVLAIERPDVLVHLAGQASVGAAQAGAHATTWSVNLGGTLNLAMAVARHVPEATLLFASSAEVYGRAFGAEPLDEEALPQPANAYARSKLMAEQILAEVLPASTGLVVARPFNHSGPGQREDFVLPSFAGQIARIEAGLQPPVLHCGNLDAARDFLDVRDVAAAYVGIIDAPSLPARFTCNIASGTARRLSEIVDMLRELSRAPFEIEIDAARLRPSDVPIAAGRADKLNSATGWKPEIPLEAMLADMLAHARRRIAPPP